MSRLSSAVSIHPYFKINAGKLDAFKTVITKFVARTKTEDLCLYYDFFFNEEHQQIHCREAYIGAEGVLAHLQNVEVCIKEALTLSELYRLEIHGPAEEIAKLREPLAALKPDFYENYGGVSKL